MKDFFAGIDVSTQGQKIVVIDLEKNSVIYFDSINYDIDLPKYGTVNGVLQNTGIGVSESDPNMWIDGIHVLFERLKTASDIIHSIKSISVSGQQHGLVGIDEDGKLTKSTSKLWNDFSTQKECEILTEQIGGAEQMIAEIANSQRVGYTASKIFHMYRHERESYDQTDYFLLVHNYINWYLTGGKIAMEEGDASGTGIWDPVKKTWSKHLIHFISDDLAELQEFLHCPNSFIVELANKVVSEYKTNQIIIRRDEE